MISRRYFLKTTGLSGLAACSGSAGFAYCFLESDVDPAVLSFIRSYGKVERVEVVQNTSAAPTDATLFVEVLAQVDDPDRFADCFQDKLPHLSDKVYADGNNLSFQSGRRFYVIRNETPAACRAAITSEARSESPVTRFCQTSVGQVLTAQKRYA